MAAGTNPSKVADRFILFALLLVILVGVTASTFSSMLPITDATVASVRALIIGDVVNDTKYETYCDENFNSAETSTGGKAASSHGRPSRVPVVTN